MLENQLMLSPTTNHPCPSQDLVVAEATRPACRDAYNELRLAKIGEDLYASQALQITEKDGKFHAVMDVKNFNPKDLQVR